MRSAVNRVEIVGEIGEERHIELGDEIVFLDSGRYIVYRSF